MFKTCKVSLLTQRFTIIASMCFFLAATLVVAADANPKLSISLQPNNLAFGNTTINQTVKKVLTISNLGSGNLSVSEILCPAGFTVNWFRGIIAPQKTQDVTVTFSPKTVQSYSGNLIIITNATSGLSAIPCSGAGMGRNAAPVANVSTLAGSGSSGFGDGIGKGVSFNAPTGVAVDTMGNVYVADSNNNRIRKITSSGVVTTLAGSGAQGSADGNGTAASFSSPSGVAVDSNGNVYVADKKNNKIRKITISP